MGKENVNPPEPRGLELIKRYKDNYSIPDEAIVTEEMILHHWELEKKLTAELMKSTPESRWDIFERAYSRLYHELPWLNELVHASKQPTPEKQYKEWVAAIGKPPKMIYEVGSGKGKMISYLSSLGYTCKATEITKERGGKFLAGSETVALGNTDGIHLDQFEEKNTYDVVLSDQVIEHLHPEDGLTHFQGVFNILKKRGRYIFSTPHLLTGPHDVSKVFKTTVAEGMHLKEYTFHEFISIANQAGFSKVSLAYNPPLIGRKMLLKVFLFTEQLLLKFPSSENRKIMAKLLKKGRLFNGDIFLEVEK